MTGTHNSQVFFRPRWNCTSRLFCLFSVWHCCFSTWCRPEAGVRLSPCLDSRVRRALCLDLKYQLLFRPCRRCGLFHLPHLRRRIITMSRLLVVSVVLVVAAAVVVVEAQGLTEAAARPKVAAGSVVISRPLSTTMAIIALRRMNTRGKTFRLLGCGTPQGRRRWRVSPRAAFCLPPAQHQAPRWLGHQTLRAEMSGRASRPRHTSHRR